MRIRPLAEANKVAILLGAGRPMQCVQVSPAGGVSDDGV